MTLTIDGFTVTGSPNELDTFIKLYRNTQNVVANIPYTIGPLDYPFFTSGKWEVTFENSNSVSNDYIDK